MSLKKNTKPHKKMTSLDSSGKRELVVNEMGKLGELTCFLNTMFLKFPLYQEKENFF